MSSSKAIFVQVGVIVAIGTAIGAADAFLLRPVSLRMETPPELPGLAPASKLATTENPSPAPPKPQTPQPEPSPAPPRASGTAFVPTPKSAMKPGHITLDEAKGSFDAGASFVDSRKREIYEAGHVQNAFKLELSDFSGGDPQVLMLIPRDNVVVVYCNGGNCDESEKVAQMLNGSGYKKVYVLQDGFPGWKAMGWPIQTGPGLIP